MRALHDLMESFKEGFHIYDHATAPYIALFTLLLPALGFLKRPKAWVGRRWVSRLQLAYIVVWFVALVAIGSSRRIASLSTSAQLSK